MWFTGISFYLKESVYYLDLPCVVTFYLFLAIEFRVFCVVFLKKGNFISFLTYDR